MNEIKQLNKEKEKERDYNKKLVKMLERQEQEADDLEQRLEQQMIDQNVSTSLGAVIISEILLPKSNRMFFFYWPSITIKKYSQFLCV